MPFTARPYGLCLPGARQGRLYITGMLCKLPLAKTQPRRRLDGARPTQLPKPAHASCRVSQGFGSFAASHLSASRKALRAFRRSRQCPRLTTPCHLMSSKLTRLCLISSRPEPWTLNAGFNSSSIQANGNSPALPARRPLKGAPRKQRL